jgi:hypothetical protein
MPRTSAIDSISSVPLRILLLKGEAFMMRSCGERGAAAQS